MGMSWQEALVYCAQNPMAEVVSRLGFKRRITDKGQAQRFADGEWQHSAINPLGAPYEKVGNAGMSGAQAASGTQQVKGAVEFSRLQSVLRSVICSPIDADRIAGALRDYITAVIRSENL